MTAHFNGLVQALQITSGVVKLVYGPRLPVFANDAAMQVLSKCE
jgi:hypothetical protein